MPTTALGALSVPTTGTESGTWGSASLNPNFVAIDGVARGAQTISLSSGTTFTLGAPSGSITPGAGPTQAQNAVLKFTGTLTGNAVITLPLPGYYIVRNNCVVGSFYVQMRAVGTGNLIGLPPGEACHVYSDGTDCDFVNMGRVGSYLDLAVAATPAWMSACSVLPYLPCDATHVYSVSSYTALAAVLGSTFGGDGATTFGTPDLGNRYRIPYSSTAGRITSAGSGINGASLGAAGGQQATTIVQGHLPNYNLTVTDGGHAHGQVGTSGFVGSVGAGGPPYYVQPTGGTTSIATTNISVALGGSGVSFPVVPPGMVAGIAFIKT